MQEQVEEKEMTARNMTDARGCVEPTYAQRVIPLPNEGDETWKSEFGNMVVGLKLEPHETHRVFVELH